MVSGNCFFGCLDKAFRASFHVVTRNATYGVFLQMIELSYGEVEHCAYPFRQRPLIAGTQEPAVFCLDNELPGRTHLRGRNNREAGSQCLRDNKAPSVVA